MVVRAKFKCSSVKHYVEGAEVILNPVTSGSEENKAFYKYTPAGSIQLMTINPEAAAQFQPGSDYYIDFTKAD